MYTWTNLLTSIVYCCSPRTTSRWGIHISYYLAMVLLHQPASWRCRRCGLLVLLRPSSYWRASSAPLVEEATACGSCWGLFGDGRHHLLRPGSSVRPHYPPLEQQLGHWSPYRLRTPCGCLVRMGDLARRLCHDAASTLQAAFALNHSALPILLHGQLHCPFVLPPHLFPEYPGREPHPVWGSQSTSCARRSCIRPGRWSCGDENRTRATGHVRRVDACHRCHWSDLHT